MKILNIDAFAKVTRQISFNGKTHAIEEPSVQQFIDNLKAAEKLEKDGDQENIGKNFAQAIVAICQAIPTLPEAEVRALKLPAMTAVLQFIRGELDPDAGAAEDSAEEGLEEKKPA